MIAALKSKRHLAFRRLVGFAFSVSKILSRPLSGVSPDSLLPPGDISRRRTTRQNRVARGELKVFEPLRRARSSYRPHDLPTVRSRPPHGSPAGRVTSSERISKAGNFPSIFWNYIQRWLLTRLSQAAPRAGHRGPRRWPEVVARKGRRIRDTRPRSPRSSAGARPTPARRTKRSVLVGGHRLAPVLWPIRRGRRGRRSPIPSQFPFLPTR